MSLCLIVKDEEATLADCLRSTAGLVDEWIIVDTGSTDRTRDVAAQFGARVFDFAWVDSFAVARNASLEPATGDWILSKRPGSLGNPKTQALDKELAGVFKGIGYELIGGAGKSQEYIPGPGGGVTGSCRPDVTLRRGNLKIRIQTVDVDSKGKIKQRELDNAEKIRSAFPNDILILIPKS